jgi:hypothetical protein
MNSLIALWKMLAEELASMCCTSAIRDIKTVSDRSNHEGLSFLTITLPTFAKGLERSLDEGAIARDMFTSFSFHAGLPRFLGGFLERVFDRSPGRLLDDVALEAIFAIRQLTLVFSKMQLPCSKSREAAAIRSFVQCEYDVKRTDMTLSEDQREVFVRISDLLFRNVCQDIDWKIFDLDLEGKHGPGKTADKLTGNGKFSLNVWPRRLESILPFGEMLLVNRSFTTRGNRVNIIEPEMETPVKVVTVPKTQKTPRVIAVEPTAMQFAQQSVSRLITRGIERHQLLSRMIGFRDQELNQVLAQKGSLDGTLATLDLSEASDRVSYQLVMSMVDRYPCLSAAIDASRSRFADVPDHGVIPLSKYASMGSALTFPIEAMVFLAVIFVGIEQELNKPLCLADVKRLSNEVRVYGDDIIIPVRFVRSVVESLETFGFKVNSSKSFWTGKFRESCGKEYYDGYDVSVVKFRHKYPTTRRHATEVIGLVAFRNLLYKRGLWRTCQWLDDRIRNLISHFPVVAETSVVVGRHSFLGYETQKMCPKLHSPLVRGLVVSAQSPSSQLDGHDALFKCLSGDRREPFIDKQHLSRAGRPNSVDTRVRWAQPF